MLRLPVGLRAPLHGTGRRVRLRFFIRLAGHDARIVTIRGAMQGLSTTTKLVYFINLDSGESTPTVGTIMFGQSDNVQFDCSAYFAKTIASAMPA